MSQNTRILQRFQYYEEDCLCEYCLYNANGKKNKINKANPCGNAVCRCDDIRQDAVANHRYKREPGWLKMD